MARFSWRKWFTQSRPTRRPVLRRSLLALEELEPRALPATPGIVSLVFTDPVTTGQPGPLYLAAYDKLIPDPVHNPKVGTWGYFAPTTGTSSGGNTTTTLNDAAANWTANQFQGSQVEITAGTGAGQLATVASNTSTQLTLSPSTPWTTTPDNTSQYAILALTFTKFTSQTQVPTFPIFFNGGNKTIATLPSFDASMPLISGRVYMSLGRPMTLPVINPTDGVTAAKPGDQNNAIVYESFELTQDATDTLYINTTNVDQFRFPYTMSVSPPASGGPAPTYGYVVNRTNVYSSLQLYLNGIDAQEAAIGGPQNATRLYSAVNNKSLFSGPSTGPNTSTTLFDANAKWVANQWLNATVTIVSGTGQDQARVITSNTDVQLTLKSAWTTIPDTTSQFQISYAGTSTGGNTATTLNDSSANWTPNEWAGDTLRITGGTGTGQAVVIVSNNKTTLTVNPSWTTTPDTTSSQYNIFSQYLTNPTNLVPMLSSYPTNTLNDYFNAALTALFQKYQLSTLTLTANGANGPVPVTGQTITDYQPPTFQSTTTGLHGNNGSSTLYTAAGLGAVLPKGQLTIGLGVSGPAGIPAGTTITGYGSAGFGGQSTYTGSNPNTATTLNDTSATWVPNQWIGCTVQITKGTGMTTPPTLYTIVSNTATQLTIQGPGFITIPDSTSQFAISAVTSVTLSKQLTQDVAAGSLTFTPEKYTVLQFKDSSNHTYNVYAPFFNNNGGYPVGFPGAGATAPDPPPWETQVSIGTSYESFSPGYMVLGNTEVFADDVPQSALGQSVADTDVLGSIENQLVSALNRGVAYLPASQWRNADLFYQPTNQSQENAANFYAGYLHNGIANVTYSDGSKGASQVALGGNVYGFGFDDNGGHDTTQTAKISSNPTVAIALTAWPSANGTAPPARQAPSFITPVNASGILFPFEQGTASSYAMTAVGYPTPTVSVTGTLPTGVSYNAVNGYGFLVSTARPGTNGSYTLTFKADNGTPPISTQPVTLMVQGSLPIGGPPPVTTHYVVTGADAGGGPLVTVRDAATGAIVFSFFAYGANFTGGVRIAVGDVNADGIPDIITAPGPGGSPYIEVFDGSTGTMIRGFYAFDPSFTGGVNVAAGDVNDDGSADIICAPDGGGGPFVKVFSGLDGSLLNGFYAYGAGFTGGVRVAAGDVNGDNFADIICAPGAGGGPYVTVWSGKDGSLLSGFYAYSAGFTAGVYVTAGDVTGAGQAEIITGAGAGGSPNVSVFSGVDGSLIESFLAYDSAFTGGVRVATAQRNDGSVAVVTVAGPGGGAQVSEFNGLTGASIDSFFASNPMFSAGLWVGGA